MIRPERNEWDIRHDARTLADAEEIKADRQRYQEAVNMADMLVKEAIERNKAMRAVAKEQPMSKKDSLNTTFADTLANMGAKCGR